MKRALSGLLLISSSAVFAQPPGNAGGNPMRTDIEDLQGRVAALEGLVATLRSQATLSKTIVSQPSSMVFAGSADSVYANLDGASALVSLEGENGTLVVIQFTAETQCAGGGTDAGWCGMRVLIDGFEASPGPADFAIDSTNEGEEGFASWESHSMQRHICFSGDGGGAVVPVQVQWRVFSSDGDVSAPSFRIDDWSLLIETSESSCP